MQHFFVEPGMIGEKEILILGEDVNHIKNVLRMKPGEVISVGNGVSDDEYRCEITEITADKVRAKIMFIKKDGVELPAEITLFQGLPKADKMELIIQKSVELGACGIVPVSTKRAVGKLDEKKAKNKTERWRSISESAAKQSKRAVIPQISEPVSFKNAIDMAKEMDLCVIPYELEEGMDGAALFLEEVRALAGKYLQKEGGASKPKIGIMIGPEGGFEEEEVEIALQNGIRPISLGRRILRTETAGMALISVLMFSLETI